MTEVPRLKARDDTAAFPERVAQFGTGAFLRGFVDYFIDEANRNGRFTGRVVAISSTGSSRDAALNEQDGLFTLAIQSTHGQEVRIIESVSRAISARDEWESVLALAREIDIQLVISNTTEVGIVLDENDRFDRQPPTSFPGKLARFLAERAAAFDYDVRRGVIVLPCELIEDNGDRLRATVETLARRWSLGPQFETWLANAVTFCNTLVDRIVPGAASVELPYRDELATACEAYALFAIQGDLKLRARLGFPGGDPRIIVAPDIRPYRERKVRVLNGGHTIMVPAALLAGLTTVREACEDERIGPFLRRAIFDEIVPSLDVPDAESFAQDVLDRFANPYIKHALVDITLSGTTKLRVRVVPSIVEYHARTGRVPQSLAFGFAANLAFMRGEFHATHTMPADAEGDRITDAWTTVDQTSDAAIAAFVQRTCGDVSLWATDLGAIPGFRDAVVDHLTRIVRHGIAPALDVHLSATANT
jgi:tagaturonate reductase